MASKRLSAAADHRVEHLILQDATQGRRLTVSLTFSPSHG